MEFYAADLADAVGAEYIEHDYQPQALPVRSTAKKRKEKQCQHSDLPMQ